jgi:hypothetical protein
VKILAGLLLALNIVASINGYFHKRWWLSTLSVAAALGLAAVWIMGRIP